MNDRVICPVCAKDFACDRDLCQHLLGKKDHMAWLRRELDSMREEIAGLKEAVAVWRNLAKEKR